MPLKHFSYPTAVLFIIGVELCETISFSGLSTILSLYLRNVLLLSENESTVTYHLFMTVCYLAPVVGTHCAYTYCGRYATLKYFGLIYLIGSIIMCIACLPVLEEYPKPFSAFALILVALGYGGVLPCGTAFGAEQFTLPEQTDLLEHFYSTFYFTINLGTFMGMSLTPLMKSLSCFGDDTCYALGFGFPAALNTISIVLFIHGKRYYKPEAPKENVFLEFFKCASYAVSHKPKNRYYDHWLDNSRGMFSLSLIEDMKQVFNIFFLYIPISIAWSLFDQLGSSWTFQASHMDGIVLGRQIMPDQMQATNPAIVIILIPIFDRLLYPFLAKFHLLENSLHRMIFGGIVAGLAFFSTGILQLFLDTAYTELPEKNLASIDVVNTLPCDLHILNQYNDLQIIHSGDIYRFKNIASQNISRYSFLVEAPLLCGNMVFHRHEFKLHVYSVEYQIDSVLIGINGGNEIHAYMSDPVDFEISLSGMPRIRIAYIKTSNKLNNVTVILQNAAGLQDVFFVRSVSRARVEESAYMELPQGVYDCIIGSRENTSLYQKQFHLALGGVYSLIIREEGTKIVFVKLYTMSLPNTVTILWQIPSYFLISVAEIMFGVSGLEFCYTQAPKTMKMVTITGWFLSEAVGNVIVIIIIQLDMFKSQAYAFFLFAVLVVADMMLFIEMASYYKYHQKFGAARYFASVSEPGRISLGLVSSADDISADEIPNLPLDMDIADQNNSSEFLTSENDTETE